MQEKTQTEIREELIDAGIDPDASFRRVRLMILEYKANHEFEQSLLEAMK
jgi:hypothetical protein